MAQVYIGCSGYVYSHWRRGVFYPENLPQNQEFVYYASKFNTVEINFTFYRLPAEGVWIKWEKQTPKGFIYAVKMSRFMTHIKKLKDPAEPWGRFARGANKLRNHLGPILVQLPPRWHRNEKRLRKLAIVLPKNMRFAFEFRDRSWFDKRTYKILRDNNWALIISSHPGLPWIEEITADFVYLRFHGGAALYQSSYSKDELKKFAEKISLWLKQDLDVYGYFNNDAEGNAPRNALQLKRYLNNL